MEQFIILLIIWLLVSVFNSLAKKSKQQKSRPKTGAPVKPRQSARSAPTTTPAQEKSEAAELEIPPFLREILGMEKPQPTPAAPPLEPEVSEEFEAEEAELPRSPLPEETIPIPEEGRIEAEEEVESAAMIPYQQIRARRSELIPKELFQKDALKRAILLKEILGEPVSRRMMPGSKLHDG